MKGESERTDGEHTDAGDCVQCESAAFGHLFGDDAQHRWPEECLADSVECGSGKDHCAGRRRQHVEAATANAALAASRPSGERA